MRTPLQMTCVAFASLITFAFVTAGDPTESDDAILNKVLADWRTRQNETKTIRYLIEGEIFWPKDRLDNVAVPGIELKKPTKDFTGPVNLELAFDFDKGLARKERTSHYPMQGEYFSRHEVRVFDGQRSNVYRTKSEKETELLYLARHDHTRTPGAFLEGSDYPVLFAHGIIPNANAHIDAKQPRLPISRNLFWLVGKTIYEKRECLVIGTNKSIPPRANFAHEFVVDPSQGNSIVKWTMSCSDINAGVLRVLYQVDIRYQQTKHGWLPKDWIANNFLQNNLNYSEKLKVIEFDVNSAFDAKTFQIELRPGMPVYDVQTNQDFRVGNDGKSLIPYR